ncbi:MAG: phosphomannomutase [Ignavibacteria bacterium CG_4_8_14_3_um_filter_37_9]|nr:phosphomannomutase [Ignavibacteria bacterium]OIO17191.1 MAG: phosphomannomutase [Ignavibacteria bacterium CG1_02_37_35]PIP76562.1 MAG: phosphomannomutase [Ignavibacteria bacterium CG22_combo_CG10-13_8_21_14_all_37_15]PIS45283.1 MAG: phosphomannomutase [Ignavibacteria bacterium CG08_land_8_20_14_0_20_37_9]PIW99742.1 MAG: phosphomannomutase [Ignavibacteria bacterium CG_4_8_14_3_um_filter_37_9]PIX93386.1 MAG: phosphomannomutase [Ignavibacteria bacterium CG_4_10_14_3_um_filter_37_18]PJC61168.1
MEKIASFKAYDIRGKVPAELNEELAYNFGRALTMHLFCKTAVIGRDVRYSSQPLSDALSKGFTDSGVNVIDIGLCGTEMIYFATSFLGTEAGVMITASHNPPEYNGMKVVKKDSVPVGYDSGLKEVEQIILQKDFPPLADKKGTVTKQNITKEFIANLDKFFDVKKLKPMKVVVNAGNGCVGPILTILEPTLPCEMIKLFIEPDPAFPNGVPNPMLEENRKPTIGAIKSNNADLGVAWDGDYDRCFFFDEFGNFIEGYYIVGLLAKSILKKFPGENIIHDPRLVWNTIEVVTNANGNAVQSKSGHAFIKQKMREVNAIYGGEMSAHHYFRENAYSDSGIIPFLLVMQLMSEEGKTLSQLTGEMMKNYPCSGEINSTISDPVAKIKEIEAAYPGGKRETVDGISVEYDRWRFNLRMSNTEPIIRLNVESRGDEKLMKEKTEELLQIIRKYEV